MLAVASGTPDHMGLAWWKLILIVIAVAVVIFGAVWIAIQLTTPGKTLHAFG